MAAKSRPFTRRCGTRLGVVAPKESNLWARAVLAAAVALIMGMLAACSDVGDSSAVPGQGGGLQPTADGGAPDGNIVDTGRPSPGRQDAGAGDTSIADDASSGDDAGGVIPSPTQDAGEIDSTLGGGTEPPSGSPDAGQDSTLSDTGMPEGSPDSTLSDSGATESGAVDSPLADAAGDSTVADAGGVDSGGPDSIADTAVSDAGAEGAPDAAETGGGDTGTPETGNDTGGGGDTPCTTAPCATSGSNSVQCKGNTSGVCTLTEAILVSFDIAHNQLTAATATNITTDKKNYCYYCMVASLCLDSAPKNSIPGVKTLGAKNFECEDTGVPAATSANPAQCRDALDCTINSNGGATPHCTSPNPPASTDPQASVSDCYCGTHLGSACNSPPPTGGPNGVCQAREETDLGTTDPTTVLARFTDGSLSPGGFGNGILNCALTNLCDACFK
jgi:hypothetical protein